MLKKNRNSRFPQILKNWIRPRLRLATALIATFLAMSLWQPAAAYPSAGTDAFDSSALITLDLSLIGGPTLTVTVAGPTIVERSKPYNPGDGRMTIDTEIVSLHLTGMTALGPVVVRESSFRESTGQVTQQTPGEDFPADSFFDVFVEIDTPLGTFLNKDPILLQAVIDSLPPFQKEYTPPPFIGVPLYTTNGRQVGVITHASHYVGQKPSFSVAPGGPSGLDAAEIFDLPTAPRIPPASLGLTTKDDLDGLSYGLDYIDPDANNMDLRFSVDDASVGVSGSAVDTEASKVPNEAHGDEFAVMPLLPFGGSNVQILDETGDTAPPFPLLISDDLDALTEPPASFVDPDGDGVPDFPVYFSLSTGSPSLGTILATPADILMSVGGGAPSVVFAAGALGLTSADDVDAFCLDLSTSTVLYSLAPGSPSLVIAGAGPADLFLVIGAGPPIATPFAYVPAFILGLDAKDNLNALKCTFPEVDYFSYSLAEITIVTKAFSETVSLVGPAVVHVAIDPTGAVREFPAGLESVQTELVAMDLTGMSSFGPVTVRLHQDPNHIPHAIPPSFGQIVEHKNNTPGKLDLPPFTRTGTAESFFDVWVEVDIPGLGTFHTHLPKRMQTTITHKPPAKWEKYVDLSGQLLELYDQNENPTGIFIGGGYHVPNPPLLVHDFPDVQAEIILDINGLTETISLEGPVTTLIVTDENGQAEDTDADGRDQVQTEILSMSLTGDSPSLGAITVVIRAHNQPPNRRSRGEIEETNNNTPGVLDLHPYGGAGTADSFFDTFFEVEISDSKLLASGSTIYHNEDPLQLLATISQDPPAGGETFQSQGMVDLLDDAGQPTGLTIESFNLTPSPLVFLPIVITCH